MLTLLLAAARKARKPAAVAALLGGLALGLFVASVPRETEAATPPIKIPAPYGTSWRITNGYNGYGPHSWAYQRYAFDIVRDDGGTTAGTPVLAPISGTVAWTAPDFGGVSLSGGDGYYVYTAHVLLTRGLSRGQFVRQGEQLGTVAPAGSTNNNGTPHIHINVYSQPTASSPASSRVPIPFDGALALDGRSFAVNGTYNQYNGVRGLRSTNGGGSPASSGADHFYTTSVSEPANAVASGYRWEGIAAYLSPGPLSGWVPLYRLWSSSGSDHFYTTSAGERDSAVARSGYVYEGVAGYVSPTPSTGLVPLYRLWSRSGSDHFYTTSAAERDSAVARSGYVSEGVAGYVSAGAASGLVPFFRWWNGAAGDHFYTTSVSEPANAVASGYRWEGIAAYLSPGPLSGWVPLYRLWSSLGSDHFYTTSAGERDSAVARSGYVYEGVAGYVSPTPSTGLVPLYRLWSSSGSDHFYTTSAAERDLAVARSGYVSEGVAGYVSAGAASGLVPFFRWWLP